MGSALQEGDIIAGKYQLEQVIAKGGMGQLWRATDKSNKLIALKFILETINLGSEGVELERRFRREARLLGRLGHPHIVNVIEYGRDYDKTVSYIAMELIQGITLADRIKKDNRDPRLNLIPRKHELTLAYHLADALDYMHSQDILHRDLKPANILIDKEGLPVIVDFGLTKDIAESHTQSGDFSATSEGDILGTPVYMAPEQLEGSKTEIGPESDQYSLGAVLYYMWSHAHPIEIIPIIPFLARALTEERQDISTKNPHLPDELAYMINRMVQKNKADRFSSVSEVRDLLHNYISDSS